MQSILSGIRIRKRLFLYLFLVGGFLSLGFVEKLFAHEMGEGAHLQVDLRKKPMALQIEVTLQEVLAIYDVDVNGDGKLQANEYRFIDPIKLASYVTQRLDLSVDGVLCDLQIVSHETIAHSAGDFIRFPIRHNCSDGGDQLTVSYQLFFDQNPYHQGTLTINQQQSSLYYFWDDQREHQLRLTDHSQLTRFFRDFQLGVYHIVVGLDHLLFLLCLILPSVLILTSGGKPHLPDRLGYQWLPTESLGRVILDVAKVVTAFTVAHSVTLILSVIEWLPKPPSAVVEIAIAITVMLVALNNLYPIIYRSRWFVTLLLGLIHGLGFANVLIAYDLPIKDVGWTLLAFNLGVEFGQLMLIGCVVPVLFWLRNQSLYVTLGLRAGSALVVAISCVWIYERAI